MTTIATHERLAIEQVRRVPSARRIALRRVRTELIMIGTGLACVLFSVGYAIAQL